MRDTAQPMLAEGDGAPELWRWIRMEFGGVARLIARTDKAFVAAVNGPAAGVGLAFALASDLIAWTGLLAHPLHEARRWEPKRLRHRLFTIPATLARHGRQWIGPGRRSR